MKCTTVQIWHTVTLLYSLFYRLLFNLENMKLSLEIIRSYGFKERTHKPDWDDTCLEITLPNGITLDTMTQCNNQPTESDALEGMNGYIYIETKEELDELVNMSYDEVINKIASENKDFDLEKYL